MAVLRGVDAGELTLKAAALEMGVSYRQAKRLAARWRASGPEGLVHRGRDGLSNRRLDPAVRRRALEVYRARYGDFGPTLAAEYLAAEEGIVVSRETVRRWLIGECLWQPGRRRCRRQRPRRERRGQLVQFDGSLHPWLEDRDGPSCLMVMIDDATNHIEAHLGPGETLEAAFAVLRRWIERHGVPEALYLDRRNIYVGNDGSQQTDFARACRELDIRLVVARSPQAKGRVERCNQMLQDRLVKALRLQGVCGIDEANAAIGPILDGINARFAREPACRVDAHRRAPSAQALDEILCRREERKVDRDGTISIDSRRWRLEPAPAPGHRVSVRRPAPGRFVVHDGRQRLKCLEGYA